MKKQKRDQHQRAFTRGYLAGAERKSKDLAPLGSAHESWMSGWREGRSDNWDGMTGIAGIHRLTL